MSDITLSRAVRSNLLSLQNTASMMETTQNRLATGKKVNSALDNPTNFFTASSLNSRAGDMNALLDGMANGIQTLEAADNGLTAITKTLESMQSTLRQARQDKSFQTKSFTLDADAIGMSEAKTLSFAGGAVGSEPVTVALNEVVDSEAVQSTYTATGAYTPPAGATGPADIVGDGAVTALVEDEELAFTINGVEVSVTGTAGTEAGADATADAIVAAIVDLQTNGTADEQAALADITVSADAGVLTFSSSATGADANITLGALAGGDAGVDTLGIADPADYVSTGGAAESFTFSIGDTEITLNATNASSFEDALGVIEDALEGTGFSVAETAEGSETFVFSGPADGSETVAITGDSAALTAVFGADDIEAVEGEEAVGGSIQTVDQLVDAINGNDDLAGLIRASNDNGKLRIENLSTQELTVTGYNNTSSKVDGGTGTSTIGGNTVRAGLAEQYNELRDQLDKLADDASFNGVNLLRGDDLQITFNETGTSEITISTKNNETINSNNLGIQTTINAEDLDSDSKIDEFLSEIKAGINEVRSQASTFGSNLSIVENRQAFTKNMINTLQTGAANLTLADSNEEAANLLALQTRQQLSSTALSMASQQDQSVLRLF